MFKKSVTLIACAAVILSGFTGCKSDETLTSNKDEYYTFTVSHYIEGDTSMPDGESAFDKYIKDKFNIKLKYSLVPRVNYEQKMNLLFAAGEQPDILTGAKEPLYNTWGNKGYIQPMDIQKVKKMTDYMAYWGEDWEKIQTLISSNDGNFYYLPSVREHKAGTDFIYRKDLFDSVGYTEFPKTTDELRDAFEKIHKLYPNKILYNERTPFYQMFWMPELMESYEISYVDPITEEYVPYGLVTQRARDMYIYMHDLYEDGLLDPEIMTSTGQRNDEKRYNGSIILAFGDPTIASTYNAKTVDSDIPEGQKVEWAYTPQMITAYPEMGTIYKRTAYYSNWGPAFSYNIDTEDKMDRILEYYNWTASPEGEEVLSFGFENVTFTYDENGNPVKNPDIYDKYDNPDGVTLYKWGIPGAKFRTDPRSSAVQKAAPLYRETEAYQMNRDDYYFFDFFPMNYSEEDDDARADLEAAVKDVKTSYGSRFIIGELDPSNDTDWEKYIEAMNNAGLKQLAQIKKNTYERSKSGK